MPMWAYLKKKVERGGPPSEKMNLKVSVMDIRSG